jgi:hypothetical protein
VEWVNYAGSRHKLHKAQVKYSPKGAGPCSPSASRRFRRRHEARYNVRIFSHLANIGDTRSLVSIRLRPHTARWTMRLSQSRPRARGRGVCPSASKIRGSDADRIKRWRAVTSTLPLPPRSAWRRPLVQPFPGPKWGSNGMSGIASIAGHSQRNLKLVQIKLGRASARQPSIACTASADL